MFRTLTKLNNYEDMKAIIKTAGAWFVGSFTMEVLDNYNLCRTKEGKDNFLSEFHVLYCDDMPDAQLRNRINCIIRIIESGMVIDAMNYVIGTSDDKIGCNDSKTNAKFLLELIESGESKLPKFE